jgi:phospholipase C
MPRPRPPLPSGVDRRTALELLGGLAVGAALPGCAGRAPVPDVSKTIDTVVVLMMENRSFDHYLGALSLEGRADVDGLVPGMSNPDPDGAPVEIHPADASCITDPPHSWAAGHEQFNEGRNDGFVRRYAARTEPAESHRVMGYFDRSKLKTYYHFADHFAVCDRWFSSLLTSTWPNRFYMLAAQNGGYKGNELGGDYSFFNIYDRLRVANKSWGAYYGNLAFSLLFPRNYPHENFRDYDRFFEDAARGQLPNLSVIEPLYGWNDDHPPTHPVSGQLFVASIYDALINSPQWERCLFIVTYDEHGGFFDHVPPGKADDMRAAEGFDQLGIRVPGLVVGPYVKPTYVSHEIYDHSSVLAFLGRLWDLPPLTLRDAGANDLFDVLDLERLADLRPRSGPALAPIEADDAELHAPECIYDIGLGWRSPKVITGQPELEDALRRRYEGTSLFRLERTREIYEGLLERAARRGVLR